MVSEEGKTKSIQPGTKLWNLEVTNYSHTNYERKKHS